MDKIIIALPDFFEGRGEVKGYTFRKVLELKNWYVYEVNSGTRIYYEVFKKRTAPVLIDFATRTKSENEVKEVYPNAAKFGFSAWTAKTLQQAKEIIQKKGL